METLQRKVRSVRRRLAWLRFVTLALRGLVWVTILAAVALIVCRLIVPIDDETAWQVWTWRIVGGLVLLAIPVGLLGAALGRTSLFGAALEADAHLGLRERLSSALLLRGPRRPMEDLLEADAVVAAERIHPRRDFPFAPPRSLRFLPLPLIALVLTALLLDQHNLLASTQPPALTEEERALIELIEQDSEEQAEEIEELAAVVEEVTNNLAASDEWSDLQLDLARLAENLRDPETSRIEDLAEISDLADEMAAQREALERQFANSRNFAADPGARMTAAIQQAMQEGDLEEAADEIAQLMEEIQEQMESGESMEDLEQLADELEQMAAQMGEGSETGQAMMEAAEAMRIAASNPNATQAMAQAMQGLSTAMSDLQSAGEQLAFSEALEADLNAMRAAMSRDPRNRPGRCPSCGSRGGQCRGGRCRGEGGKWRLSRYTGEWSAGETWKRRGQGMGGPGQGRGGRAPFSDDDDATFRDEQLVGPHLPGRIIAEFPHQDNVQIAGESHLELSDVYLSYAQEAEQTLETEVIPAGYRNITRRYFTAIHPVQVVEDDAGTDASP